MAVVRPGGHSTRRRSWGVVPWRRASARRATALTGLRATPDLVQSPTQPAQCCLLFSVTNQKLPESPVTLLPSPLMSIPFPHPGATCFPFCSCTYFSPPLPLHVQSVSSPFRRLQCPSTSVFTAPPSVCQWVRTISSNSNPLPSWLKQHPICPKIKTLYPCDGRLRMALSCSDQRCHPVPKSLWALRPFHGAVLAP